MTTVGLDDSSPLLADRYQLVTELGRDRIFVSYAARDLAGESDVIVKVVLPEIGPTADANRLLDALRSAAGLAGDHIHQVIDVGNVEGFCYVVQPDLAAPTLRNYLGTRRKLPIRDGGRLVTDIAEALIFAHAREVAHGDVTLDSIYVKDGRAIVSDFCAAIVLDFAEAMSGRRDGFAKRRHADLDALGRLTYRLLGGGEVPDEYQSQPANGGPDRRAIAPIVVPRRRRSVDHGVFLPEERRYVTDGRRARRSVVFKALRVLLYATAALIPLLITAYAVLKLG